MELTTLKNAELEADSTAELETGEIELTAEAETELETDEPPHNPGPETAYIPISLTLIVTSQPSPSP